MYADRTGKASAMELPKLLVPCQGRAYIAVEQLQSAAGALEAAGEADAAQHSHAAQPPESAWDSVHQVTWASVT